MTTAAKIQALWGERPMDFDCVFIGRGRGNEVASLFEMPHNTPTGQYQRTWFGRVPLYVLRSDWQYLWKYRLRPGRYVWRRFTVKAGFVNDAASVPRPFQWLLGQDGPHRAAYIPHDVLYRYRGMPPKHVAQVHEASIDPVTLAVAWRSVEMDCTRLGTDRFFRKLCREAGTLALTRHMAYAGVRLGGFTSWRDNT